MFMCFPPRGVLGSSGKQLRTLSGGGFLGCFSRNGESLLLILLLQLLLLLLVGPLA